MKKIFTILSIAALGVFANAQTNWILNPGFENWTNGKPDDWTVPNTISQSSTIKHSGNYSIGVTTANGTQTIGATDINVTVGPTYVFSAWVLDNVDNGRARIWGQWRDASGAMSGAGTDNLQQTDYSANNPSWVQISLEGVAPAGAQSMRASVRGYKDADGSFGGVIYFDDVMFYDKATLGTINIKDFDNQVKMNTLVKDELTLVLPSRSTVNVYSTDGKLISSNRVDNGGKINMSNLNKGMYIVTVQDNFNNKVSRKVVKQ